MIGDTSINCFDYRVLSYSREALSLRNGVLPAPRFAIFYPTYRCNHNCTGCDYAGLNNPSRSSMVTGDAFQHIINQIITFNIKAVEFCGGGEPLLHPEIDTAFHRFRKAGIKTGLLTNGTEISDARAKMLVNECSYIRVSIESGTEKIFTRVKRPSTPDADFTNVVRNIGNLIKYRNEVQSPCQISLKYTVDQNNCNDLENAITLATALNVDNIQFKCARNVPTELPYKRKVTLNHTLQLLKKQHTSLPIIGSLLPQHVSVQCWLSPLHLLIDPLGDLFLCCYYRHRLERHKYGNLFNRSLSENWYSKEHREALLSIRKEECEKYDCRFGRYGEFMAKYIDNGQMDFL